MKTVAFPTRLKLSEKENFNGILTKFKPPKPGSLSEFAIDHIRILSIGLELACNGG